MRFLSLVSLCASSCFAANAYALQGNCEKQALYAAVGAAQGAYEASAGNTDPSFKVYPHSYYTEVLSVSKVGEGQVEVVNVHAMSTGEQSLVAVVSVFSKKNSQADGITCSISNIEMM